MKAETFFFNMRKKIIEISQLHITTTSQCHITTSQHFWMFMMFVSAYYFKFVFSFRKIDRRRLSLLKTQHILIYIVVALDFIYQRIYSILSLYNATKPWERGWLQFWQRKLKEVFHLYCNWRLKQRDKTLSQNIFNNFSLINSNWKKCYLKNYGRD